MAATHSQSDLQFEIGHVLFIDIVGYSKLLIDQQRERIRELKEIVRGTEQFRRAEAEGKLLRLPTGDGGALVFRNTQEAPVLCALEISKAIKNYPELRIRMGIHSGPVNEVADLNEQINVAGAGINIARRVMDCDSLLKAISFYERAVQLDPKFALAWARLSRAHAFAYFFPFDATSARRDAARKALENAQKLQPNSPETLLALGYYQYHVLRDYGSAKTTFERVSKMLPGSGEVPEALGYIARREGHWDESVAYWEQALALDPLNVELLMQAAWTHTELRRFPAALKFHDRVLDIKPNDPDAMATKASIYQAQGNLQEAAKLLSEVNAQTPSLTAFHINITELRLERNLGEATRLLQARQTQFHFTSEFDKGINQVWLAWTQRLSGDTAGAKVTAAQALNTLEPLCNDQPENAFFVAELSLANAVLGEKQAALKEAERAVMLLPSIKDRVWGAVLEENLAVIQMWVGENSRAISTLTRLLQTPYSGWIYGFGRTPLTPALLRLDPHWDPLRADPAFQKLCEGKQP
jgi:tetratricopeptide (TPR) repeat protein